MKRRADGDPAERGRRCIVTGVSAPREGLVRFVVDPSGTLVPDLTEALPGRGIWVSASRAALEKACAQGLFARAARRPIVVPSDLLDRIERQLTERLLNLLGLARRAGALVMGFEKVRSALAQGRVAVLVEASDGARHGRNRLAGLAADLPVVAQLDSAALSRSLGRDTVVHVALMPGRLADQVLGESVRLAGVRLAPSATIATDDRSAH